MILATKEIANIEHLNLQAFRNRIPRIETPSSNLINIYAQGNLVIVDTPGPNEAQLCKQLQEIVTAELRKASVIFVVLNYATLNTVADEKIKKEISELKNIQGNSDALYAIVNKVDQRRKGDMSKDEVKNFVRVKYGIEEVSTTDVYNRRIFELKAVFALPAKRFLVEYEWLKKNNIHIKKENKTTMNDLCSELYGLDWETEQDTITLEQLHKGALTMWKTSGFDELLHIIVSNLIQQISSHIVRSAFNKCHRINYELIKYLQQRQLLISNNQQELNTEKMKLEDQMCLIKNIHSQRDTHLQPLQQSMDHELKEMSILSPTNRHQLISNSTLLSDEQKSNNFERTLKGFIVGGAITTTVILAFGAASPLALISEASLAACGVYQCFGNDRPDSIYFPFERYKTWQKFRVELTNDIRGVCNKDLSIIRVQIDGRCKRFSEKDGGGFVQKMALTEN